MKLLRCLSLFRFFFFFSLTFFLSSASDFFFLIPPSPLAYNIRSRTFRTLYSTSTYRIRRVPVLRFVFFFTPLGIPRFPFFLGSVSKNLYGYRAVTIQLTLNTVAIREQCSHNNRPYQSDDIFLSQKRHVTFQILKISIL